LAEIVAVRGGTIDLDIGDGSSEPKEFAGAAASEIAAVLRDSFNSAPPLQPRPPSQPQMGSLVYISDFTLEDLGEVRAWMSRAESEGIRCAAIMVVSPTDVEMTEFGGMAGGGLSDRTELTSAELSRFQVDRQHRVADVFANSTGGAVVVSTLLDAAGLVELLASSRVMEVLR
jgi:hypothetical protein